MDQAVRAVLDTWTYNVVLRRGVRLPSSRIPSVLLQADTGYVVQATVSMATRRIQVQLHTHRLPEVQLGGCTGSSTTNTTTTLPPQSHHQSKFYHQAIALPLGIPVQQVRVQLLDPLDEQQRLLL